MRAVEYLDLDGLLRLTHKLGAGPVRDLGLLESACARPQTNVFGHEAYPTVAEKAASLLHSLCKNRALVDGNKRLTWFAAVSFLALNGRDVTLTDDAAFDLVQQVADGSLDDVHDIAAALRENTAER